MCLWPRSGVDLSCKDFPERKVPVPVLPCDREDRFRPKRGNCFPVWLCGLDEPSGQEGLGLQYTLSGIAEPPLI